MNCELWFFRSPHIRFTTHSYFLHSFSTIGIYTGVQDQKIEPVPRLSPSGDASPKTCSASGKIAFVPDISEELVQLTKAIFDAGGKIAALGTFLSENYFGVFDWIMKSSKHTCSHYEFMDRCIMYPQGSAPLRCANKELF